MNPRTIVRASAQTTAYPGEIELRFPYSGELVDDLKEAVPARHRRWVPEEKLWRVTVPYTKVAIDLLTAHFPDAETPDNHECPSPAAVVTIPRIVAPVPLPIEKPLIATVAKPPPDPSEPAPILASINCPRCRVRYEQPIRVVAETSAKVAKRPITPELVAVCPSCHALAVVAFHPVAVPVAVGA